MKRLALVALMLTLGACGGQQGGPAEDSGAETPEVSAGADPTVQTCLELVADAQYADAVPACLAAVDQEPQSERARAALEQARAGLSQLEAGAAELEGAAEAYPGTPSD